MDNSGDLGAWEATTFDLSSASFFLGREGPGKTPPPGSGGGSSEKGIRDGIVHVQSSALPSKDVVGMGRAHNTTR